MDRLDSIFRLNLRPLEKSDTWQGIHRHENTGDEKAKDHGRQKKDETPTDDDTVLSLAALHGFLLMLVQQTPPAQEAQAIPDTAPHAAPTQETRRAARAAGAYENTARTTQPGSRVSLTDSGSAPAPAGPHVPLSADEIRNIHALIEDVEKLAERGIATMTIPPAESFLQSLKNGVAQALANSES